MADISETERDECEALLLRAIAMVHDPDGSRSVGGLSGGALQSVNVIAPAQAAPIMAVGNGEADGSDECAELLARAIAMVRGRSAPI